MYKVKEVIKMKYLFIDDIRNPFDYINSQHGDYVIEAKKL